MRRVFAFAAAVLAAGVLAAPAGAQPQPRAREAGAGASVALFAVQKLGDLAANQNAGNGFGQFLMQMGFGDANAAKLEEIQATLREINTKLDAIQRSLNQIKARVEKGNCESVQLSLGSIQAAVQLAWMSFNSAVSEAKNEVGNVAEQQLTAQRLQAKIREAFVGTSPALAVLRIHDALAGTGGSPSMIDNCGVAYQEASGEFVSAHLHEEVSAKVNYWQALEAQAAVIAIGQLVDEGNQSEARSERQSVEADLAHETAKIKPSLGTQVLDVRTHILWDRKFQTRPYNSVHIGPGALFKFPTLEEARALFGNCCNGKTAFQWLRQDTPFEVPDHRDGVAQAMVTETKAILSVGQFAIPLNSDKPTWIWVQPSQDAYVNYVNLKGKDEWPKYLYHS